VSLFPVLFLYFNNITEVSADEILKISFIYIAISMIIFILTLLIVKSPAKSALTAVISILIFANFALVEKAIIEIFATMRYWHVLMILLTVGIILTVLIIKKLSDENAVKVVQIITIVFAGLIFLNIITNVSGIQQRIAYNSSAEDNNEKASEIFTDSEVLPNIHLLFFDEFAPVDVAQEYYDYDNQWLVDSLEEKGFTVSGSSANDYADTLVATTNVFNLDYVVSLNDGLVSEEKQEIRQNGEFFSMLSENGYEFHIMADAGRLYPLDDASAEQAATTIEGYDFEQVMWNNSLLYPLFEPKTIDWRAQEVLDALEYYQSENSFEKSSNQFLFTYLTSPHQPFVFRENGDIVPSSHWNDWGDPQYYRGQYAFDSKVIDEIADLIVSKDADSIIIIMSDHGPRGLYDPATGESIIPSEIKRNIFAAVYYRGEDISEIDGQSGVNIMRTILSRLFKTDMPLVEMPVE